MVVIRQPCVSGAFYPSEPNELIEMIEYCYFHKLGPKKMPTFGEYLKPIGLVCPHAGYIYSGPTAAHSYYHMSKYVDGDITVVILGPNHTGLGSGIGTMKGIWRTPLGDVLTDDEFVEELWKDCEIMDLDETCHLREHSIEVQLPFLQHMSLLNKMRFKIVPISMMMQDYESAMEVGYSIAKISKKLNRKLVIISSTDFSHYVPQDVAAKLDALVIGDILELNERKLYSDVVNYNISMCGYGPTMAMIKAMKELGVSEAKLLSYSTSGDITGDYSSVVGYGSLIIK